MKAIAGREWDGGFGFRPFSIKTTNREFKFSRRSAMADERLTTSNMSVVWTPNMQETLIGGVLQGRKQFDPRGASQICRSRMWKAVVDVVALCGLVGLERVITGCRYSDVKEGLDVLKDRRRVKSEVIAEALSGWTRNGGDDAFQLEGDLA
jgi:tRNA-specific adenosine deaminase 1